MVEAYFRLLPRQCVPLKGTKGEEWRIKQVCAMKCWLFFLVFMYHRKYEQTVDYHNVFQPYKYHQYYLYDLSFFH